jgi:[ribosomal protein S5]-alanine N-acetyltransferase
MRIKTARLTLRDFVADDWRAVQAFQSDPRYLRFYEWESRPESAVRAFVQRFIDWQNAQPRTRFQPAIELDGRLIGDCGIRFTDLANREAEIGYELDPNFWHNGYATEAGHAMLAFGFRDLKLHRVSSWCIADNVASAHVLEKLGLKSEGRVREQKWFKGRWWDVLLFGLLDREFEIASGSRMQLEET